MAQCDICDKEVESIGVHYPTEHGLNASVYYQKRGKQKW